MRTVIVANVPELDVSPYSALLREADLLIAADGGALPLLRSGILPHVVVGDLDSLDTKSEAELERQGVELQRHTRAKDETDFELALLLAAERGATEIDVLGALGGRWDHTLANVWMLAHPVLEERPTRLLADKQTLFLVRQYTVVQGRIGDTVSLLPLTPQVHGVTTTGMVYPLNQATLHAYEARGVSNVLATEHAEVAISNGLLIVVQHDDGGAHQWNARRPEAQSNTNE